ncbi:3-deoxy-D-manno-octulosonic acid transferase [Algoriphagus sp. AK58]|uniref:3-deoxy-D-manno-octulosonic acid transferase n=1 Tax=Algoriphagus sp. AK58 TaxID=1406877 RepID=UPI00165027DC|nr:glycosyltransferase N-terminal domain-containing protein [Algoriphagus sp. AK58]MBC6366488.1 3-deoxy-D-manno-octulosonic acid transferase [Algoriphagus sp. AK58]
MKFIYRLLLGIITGVLPLLGIFSAKLRHFLSGRDNLFLLLKKFRENHPGPLAWFHVASLGEFEQARPVIAELKKQRSECLIAVSFFSPSGFDHVSKKPHANVDFITYIPLDRKSWADRFVSILNPEIAFFVKYDLWYHHICALKRDRVPTYLIAASFRENQIYFSWYGVFFRTILAQLDWIFTQNQKSIELLEKIGITRASLVGDTRFDRVAETAQTPKELGEVSAWVHGKPTIVVGSAWEEDMRLLIPLINSKPEYRWIIAPHDLKPEPMDRWASQITLDSEKYSRWTPDDPNSVLFIDNIGMLSSLYQFARVAYVGGAFGKGLHNILEPLGFGVPVIFGKVKKAGKFPEAEQSQYEGCGFEIEDEKQLQQIFTKLEQVEFYQRATESAQNWVTSNLGAANRIVTFITAKNLSK